MDETVAHRTVNESGHGQKGSAVVILLFSQSGQSANKGRGTRCRAFLPGSVHTGSVHKPGASLIWLFFLGPGCI